MLFDILSQSHDFVEIKHPFDEKNPILQTSSFFEKRMLNGYYFLIENIYQYLPVEFVKEEIKNGKHFVIVGDKKVFNDKEYYKIFIKTKEHDYPTFEPDFKNKVCKYLKNYFNEKVENFLKN